MKPLARYPILVHGRFDEIALPAPEWEVLPGVPCGRPDEFLSPAYWAYQASGEAVEWDDHHGLDASRSLLEQVAFCLLGGHGITYEINLAAFDRLVDNGILQRGTVEAGDVESLLAEPLTVDARRVRYRFPRVKARFIALAHRQLMTGAAPSEAKALRDWLLGIKGVGPKTASWIVRNHLGSDDVAILDIHVLRAGRLAVIFTERDDVQRHYFAMEDRFLSFARALGVRSSQLDIVMWRQMRRSPTAVQAAFKSKSFSLNG